MSLRAVKPQHETRTRILDAAEELFMQHGFEATSMRLLTSRAAVNLAAVNYHFGDKGGLYREVLQLAIETMRATTDAARAAGRGLPAEERLRAYIRVSLCRATPRTSYNPPL